MGTRGSLLVAVVLLAAAVVVVQTNVHQRLVVEGGPTYRVHRWTGEVWILSQGQWHPVTSPASPSAAVREVADDGAERYARGLHAAQDRYFREHGQYARGLNDLVTDTPLISGSVGFEQREATHYCIAVRHQDGGTTFYVSEQGVTRDPPGPRCPRR